MATQFPEGYRLIDGNYFKLGDRSGPYSIDENGVATLMSGGGGGGGGGASTIADGADVALGARADAAATTDTGTFSLIALAKRALQNWTTLLGRLPALVGGKVPVDVAFPATQAVSAAALPLPTGAATSAAQTTGNASLASIDGKVPPLGAAASAAAVPVVLATNDAQIGTKITAVAALPAGGTGLIGWLSRVWQAFQDQLPASLGPKTAAASLSVAPATDANVARESYGTVTPLSIATSNPGTNFTQVGSQACTSLDLINNTGTALEYRRGAGGTVFIPVPNGTSRLIQGITNANTIYVRRVDQSNTVVTAVAEAFAV